MKNELTDYGIALGQIGKLKLIGLISRVLGLFLMIFTVVLCLLALFTFGAVAAIDAMAAYMPVWVAALIISCAYIILIAVAILCRKPLFVNPFISLLSKHVITTEQELELATIKAEYEVERQVSQFSLYASIITRVWKWFAAKRKKDK